MLSPRPEAPTSPGSHSVFGFRGWVLIRGLFRFSRFRSLPHAETAAFTIPGCDLTHRVVFDDDGHFARLTKRGWPTKADAGRGVF